MDKGLGLALQTNLLLKLLLVGGSYAANHSETMLENRCLLTAILAENCVNNTKPSSMYIQMTLPEKYYNFLLPEASIGLRVLSLPASVRPSVSPSVTKFVRAITHHPFKLGSPNLDHRCKRPWLRSLLFWGVIDLDLQGQI